MILQQRNTPFDYRLNEEYQQVREALLHTNATENLKRELGYWALPSDRGLPNALLGRPVDVLIETPLDQLAKIQGIGTKKLQSLVVLLKRALNDSGETQVLKSKERQQVINSPDLKFDPVKISETQWQKWQKSIERCGLRDEKLGRVAPTLQRIKITLWDSTLATYLECDLAELRRRKNHGPKTVSSILEVFYELGRTLPIVENGMLKLRLMASKICAIENWTSALVRSGDSAEQSHVIDHIAKPIADQLEIDGGSTAKEVFEKSVGVETPPMQQRDISKILGITRGQFYQERQLCSRILNVRWPEGLSRLQYLKSTINTAGSFEIRSSIRLIDSICQVYYASRS